MICSNCDYEMEESTSAIWHWHCSRCEIQTRMEEYHEE